MASLGHNELNGNFPIIHYSSVIMRAMASQITSISSVDSNACSGADQRKHQSSASLASVRTGEFPTQRASNAENVPNRVLHTLDVAADNCLTGDFRLARPHWNNMARLSCHAKYPNPLQMYGWVICFEINCTWKQMSRRVMFAYRCWPEI